MAKGNPELGRGLFGFQVIHLSLRKAKAGDQGRDTEAGAEADPMEECCLLVCSLWLAQLAFLYNPGPGWALASHSMKRRSHGIYRGQYGGANFLRLFLPLPR